MQGVRQERDVFRAAFARRSLQTDRYAICNTVCAGISRKVVSRVGLEPTTRCLRGSCSTIELPAHGNFEIVTRDFHAPNAERRTELTNIGVGWPRFP